VSTSIKSTRTTRRARTKGVAGPPAPRRGRPPLQAAGADAAPALGRERILEAALALIDRDGLAALNIRALAAALGVAPAALYWHVPNRDAVLSGAIGLALSGIAPRLAGGSWQQRLRGVLKLFRDALRKHPNLAPSVASELASNLTLDAPLLDHVVAALEDAGFDGPALVDAFNVVMAAMCGFATLELSTAPPGDADERASWEAACRAEIDAVDAERHPHLSRHLPGLRNRAFLLRWTSGVKRPLDSGFEAWMDVVVAGLELHAKAARRGARGTA
jgi:TetR/AcrR family tetracycline transcriptional repressor